MQSKATFGVLALSYGLSLTIPTKSDRGNADQMTYTLAAIFADEPMRGTEKKLSVGSTPLPVAVCSYSRQSVNPIQ